MAITIVGLPWARAAVSIASYTFLPFGRVALARDEVAGGDDLGTGPLGVVGDLIWLVLAGWWLALGHLITAVALAVTMIGIPFAWAHLKLAGACRSGRSGGRSSASRRRRRCAVAGSRQRGAPRVGVRAEPPMG